MFLHPGHHSRHPAQQFHGLDSRQLLDDNKLRQPESWRYHTDVVKYHFNSHGYRCPEFNTVDWNNSIVLFGCSMAMGTAVDQTEIFSTLLQDDIGVPVINLGVSGSSILFSLINQYRLAENKFIPKAVINMWTYPNRVTQVLDNEVIEHHGPWTPYYKDFVDQDFFRVNSDDNQCMFMSREYIRMAKVLWRDIIHIQGTYSPKIAEMGIHLYEELDLGRDLMHPGKETHQATAKHLASLLQAEGL